MEIDRSQVEHVARLARLELSEEELRQMAGELQQILEHAGRIQELDLEGMEPTQHAVVFEGSLRKDEIGVSLPRDEAISGAPEAEDGFFSVPRIVEE